MSPFWPLVALCVVLGALCVVTDGYVQGALFTAQVLAFIGLLAVLVAERRWQ